MFVVWCTVGPSVVRLIVLVCGDGCRLWLNVMRL